MSTKIKHETTTRTRKLLAILIAFIFLFTTVASPVAALTEVENGEVETEAVATEEAVEETAKTTEEVATEPDEEQAEESGLDYLDNPEKLPGDYPEGEALVCYVKESNLSESPSNLCASLCEEENATEEEEETLTETVDLLKNAETLMTLDDTSKREVAVENNALKASVRQSQKVDEVIALVKSDTMSTTELVNALNALPNVDFAHPNYREKVKETYYDRQWAYNKTLSNYHMNISDWNIKTNLNAKDVVVAVLDTGVAYNHEDLRNVMWSDGLEYEALTDLGGGMYGLNTAADKSTATNKDSTDPMDQDNHGTHCAGIIGAEWNDKGVSGACNGVKIMAVASLAGKYLYSDDLIQGMEYIATAAHEGVNVVAVNNSWGSSPSTSTCSSYIKGINKLKDENVMAVFAAGNEYADTDVYYNNYYSEEKEEYWTGRFQAYYFTQQENAIIVGSHGKYGDKAYYSNYGKNTVDVFAPGGDSSYSGGSIYSTVPGGYAYMQGTSMACPAITAEVAILRAQYPEATMSEVRTAVRKVTTGSADIQSKCISGGYANVGKALDYLEGIYGSTPKHTVTLDPNEGTISTSSVTIREGSTYGTLPTPTRTGYTFDGWYTAKTGGTKITSSTVFNSTEDITIYAHWTVGQYTVTFNSNGGNSVSPSSIKVTYNSTYGGLPTPTRTGYVFDGWYTASTGGSKIESTTTVAITANQTLYAQWREPQVIYYANGHGTAPSATKLSYKSKVSVAGAINATGYTFRGWNTKADGKGTSYTAGSQLKGSYKTWTQGDLTLYAQWEEKTYTLSYDANGHGTAPASTSAKYSAEMKVASAISATGYTFKGWNTRSDGTGTNYQPGDTIKGENNELSVTKLYAKWEKIVVKHTVTLHLNEGSLVNNLTEYIEGEVTQLPTPTRTNYTFTGWFTNPELTGNTVTSIPSTATTNVEYYAGWEAASYKVTLNTNNGTISSGNINSYTYGIGATLPTAVSKTGYTFAGWYDNAQFSGNAYTVISSLATGDKNFWAKWTGNTLTVYFNGNGGTASKSSTTVTYGSTYSSMATASRTGYKFDGWFTSAQGGTQVQSGDAVTITSNQTLYAHWTPTAETIKNKFSYTAEKFTQEQLADYLSGKGSKPNITIMDADNNTLVEGTDYTTVFNYDEQNKTATLTVKFNTSKYGTDGDGSVITVVKTVEIGCEHKSSHRVTDRANTAYDGIAHDCCNNCGVWTRGQYEYFNALSASYVKKLKASKSKKAFTVKWKKQSKKVRKKFSHYQIQYGTSPSFYNPIVTVKNSKASKKIKGARKTRYYYRVRTIAYGYPSGWSGWKSVKTK